MSERRPDYQVETDRPEKDPQAATMALNDLGWVGRDRDAADTVALREHLQHANGLRGLEILAPDEVERAVRIFRRDGFVVVRDALTEAQTQFLQAGCDAVIHEILALDRHRIGNRGSHRYSFGSASRTRQLLHRPEWAMLVDLPTVTPILTAIFGATTYMCYGAGGDMCLPGAVEYQRLHADISDRREFGDVTLGSFADHRGALTLRDMPVPSVTCNFLTVDSTPLNGPIRQIPGTQHSREPLPTLSEEPAWMQLSTVCPAPAGSVIIRDVRAWHGGTPNVSDQVRSIPNVEFWAPWYREEFVRCMPRDMHASLSTFGQHLCRHIVVDSDATLDVGWRDDLGKTPGILRDKNRDTPIRF